MINLPMRIVMKITKSSSSLVFLFFILSWLVRAETIVPKNDITFIQHEYKEDEYYNSTQCPEGAASSYISVSRKYPAIVGLKNNEVQKKINILLKKEAGLNENKWDYPTSIEVTYEITSKSNNEMSLVFLHHHMVCGANHGTYWYNPINLNLTTGKLHTFDDLFVKKYNKTINAILKKQLIQSLGSLGGISRACKGDKNLKEEFCLYTTNNDKFTYDDKSLFIYFNMYEIGAASIGAPVIKIPLTEILGIINPKGPLAFSLNKEGIM